MEKIRFFIEAFLFRFLLTSIEKMSLTLAYKVAFFLAQLNLRILKIRVDVVQRQLRKSFVDKNQDEIEELVEKVFINLAMTAIEFGWFANKTIAEKERFVRYEGLKNLKYALKQGKGVLLFMGHFGNWELAAQIIAQKTKKMVAVAKSQKNPYFTEIVNSIRSFNHIKIIKKNFALRGIARALKKNKIVLMLGDQTARKQYVRVKFFGRKAATPVGAAKIALRYQCPIVFGSLTRRRNFKFKFKFSEPINIPRQGEEKQLVKQYTMLLTNMLENEVRKYPAQWFWVHRRWKR